MRVSSSTPTTSPSRATIAYPLITALTTDLQLAPPSKVLRELGHGSRVAETLLYLPCYCFQIPGLEASLIKDSLRMHVASTEGTIRCKIRCCSDVKAISHLLLAGD